ncbi:HK97 gp10 family phage protein [Clostridium butyricum]|uniref:HK97 gp10 family phage protein n=1 Tax=Clostridium butyricum TaxID=1492 RepID=UPI00325B2505
MDFNVNMAELKEMAMNACVEALEDTATIAVGEIKAITPVAFGVLRRSMTHGDVNKYTLSVDVGSNIYYAPYVEEGYTQKEGLYVPVLGKKLTGKHIDGRWMIRDGLTIAETKLEGILQQKLEEVFKND